MSQGLVQSSPPDDSRILKPAVAPAPLSDLVTRASLARTVGKPVADPALSTRKLYVGDWAGFVAWCRVQHRAPLPATGETLAAYLLAVAPTLSRSALGRRRAAIGAMHREANLPGPRLDAANRKALRNASKARGCGIHKTAPTVATLAQIAARCPRDLAGLQDRPFC